MPGPVIVVDDAIAHAREALAGLGEVRALPSTALGAETLAALEPAALVVRSVTRVDAELLDRVPTLGLVATATAGTDHLDLDELERRGVAVASAAGCNARAVAEWVVAALSFVAERLPPTLGDGPIGIVGFGNVGSRLTALLRALGHQVLACDPPLARAGAVAEPLVAFDELWARCPIVSFHVPLIRDGPDRTLGYVTRARPAAAGAKLLINTSRGPVIRDEALARPDVAAAILDVWDGEPELHWSRLSDPRVLLASPHVAGYSLEAKLAATRMMHEAVSAWRGRPPSWTGDELLEPRRLAGPLEGFADARRVLARVVDLAGDDARVRALASRPARERAPGFEALRRGYRLRREFRAWHIDRAAVATPALADWLRHAGFDEALDP